MREYKFTSGDEILVSFQVPDNDEDLIRRMDNYMLESLFSIITSKDSPVYIELSPDE